MTGKNSEKSFVGGVTEYRGPSLDRMSATKAGGSM